MQALALTEMVLFGGGYISAVRGLLNGELMRVVADPKKDAAGGGGEGFGGEGGGEGGGGAGTGAPCTHGQGMQGHRMRCPDFRCIA